MPDTPSSTNRDSACRGDDFARLFGRNARQIYSYILTLIPNWADAEDIFQETSTILWEKFHEYTPGTNFRAWACQVAYYRVVWFQKRQKKVAVPFSEEFFRLVAIETTSQESLLEERHLALADCVQRLIATDRDLIERCYTPGITIKQVAADIGRPPEATYKALKRIHRELFDCVEVTMKDKD
jgi:RNA polymerase sigma-70 factor, ECF subfamily